MAWTLLLGLLCALPSPAGTIDDIQRLIGELASRVQQAQRVVQVAAGRLATDVRTKTQDQFNKAWAETGLVGDAAANAAALLLKAQQACVKNDSKLMQSLADAAAQTDKLSREATALVVQIPDTTAAITRTANSSLASGSQSLIENRQTTW